MKSAISKVSGYDVQLLMAKLDRASGYLPYSHSEQLPLHDYSVQADTDTNERESVGEKAASTISSDHLRNQAPPKHILQLRSIVEQMRRNRLLPSDKDNDTASQDCRFCYCELGCGTAKLSDQLSECLDGKASHVLVDRKVFDKKKRLRDGALRARVAAANASTTRTTTPEFRVKRYTMDIGNISSIPSICDSLCFCDNENADGSMPPDEVSSDSPAGIVPVVMSKHLCGVAADLAISCSGPYRTPMVVATCCHYLCCWSDFAEFFETVGFTKRDFQVLTIVSQWASIHLKGCNLGNVVYDGADAKNENSQHRTKPTDANGWMTFSPIEPTTTTLSDAVSEEHFVDSKEFEKTFLKSSKVALGKQCKLFLDTARAYRLKDFGYRVKLVRYTTLSVEDHLLVAIPP